MYCMIQSVVGFVTIRSRDDDVDRSRVSCELNVTNLEPPSSSFNAPGLMRIRLNRPTVYRNTASVGLEVGTW